MCADVQNLPGGPVTILVDYMPAGDSIDYRADAEKSTQEAESQETPGAGHQAREEAGKAEGPQFDPKSDKPYPLSRSKVELFLE